MVRILDRIARAALLGLHNNSAPVGGWRAVRNESSHVSDFSDPNGLREDDERSRAPSWSVRRQHGTSHIVGCLFTGDDAVLDEAVSTLKANPNVTVNANGYCDAIGGENENCENRFRIVSP